MKPQKSYYPKPTEVERGWQLVDADDQILGRLASKIAKILMGKNTAAYTPSVDTGDFVVVINADKVNVTGKKASDKIYYRHSGYPGGLKEISFEDQMKKDSTKVIYDAVRGMLPKNRLGKQILTKVKIYSGDEHPHQAQLKSEPKA